MITLYFSSIVHHKLFELITVKRKDESKPARAFGDYEVKTAPGGVTGTELM